MSSQPGTRGLLARLDGPSRPARRASLSSVGSATRWLAAALLAAATTPAGRVAAQEPASGSIVVPDDPAYEDAVEFGRAVVDSLVAALEFPGLGVAVAVDGEVVWAEGRGFADLEREVRLDARAVFPIYSVSKGLTGLALARLHERGVVDLDAPIQRYLPTFPVKPDGEITARLLAGHLAGVRHYRDGAGEGTALRHCRAAADGLRFFAEDPLVHTPGTDFAYSSYGYVLLSALMAAAADRGFGRILWEEVFAPLRATSSYATDPPRDDPRQASLYEYRDEVGVVPARRMDRSCKFGAGAVASTASDLARIGSGMLGDAYLAPATRALLLTPQTNAAGKAIVTGLGWDIGETETGVRWLRRTGGNVDAWSALIALPESRVSVALLANMRGRDWMHGDAIRIGIAFADATEASERPAAHRLDEPPLLLVNATVVDVDTGRLLRDRVVRIQAGRIAAVDTAGDRSIPANARVIDVGGRYVLPGLADMHTHVGTDAEALYLANGVTSVRVMMGTEEELGARRDPMAPGPAGLRVWLAGPLLAGRETPWPSELVTTPDEGRDRVRAHAAAGYDFVKVYDGLDEATYGAIVDEAARVGLPVVGHVPQAVGVGGVVSAGQRSIEHVEQLLYAAFGRDGVMTLPLGRLPSAVEPLRGHGVFVTPTLAVQERLQRRGTPWYEAQLDREELRWMEPSLEGWWRQGRGDRPEPAALGRRRQFFQIQQELTSGLAEAGIRLLAGTDTPYPLMVPGFSLHHELEALGAAGLSPLEVVRTATRNPALFLGREDEMGFVGPGAVADLLVVDGNPLDDLATLRRPWAVVSRGALLERSDLDDLLEAASP